MTPTKYEVLIHLYISNLKKSPTSNKNKCNGCCNGKPKNGLGFPGPRQCVAVIQAARKLLV